MSWRIHHANSEQYASQAEAALRQRDTARATALYRQAAEEETAALAALDSAKLRTLGITAVSAASLWYKAHELAEAEHVAHQWMATKLLPPFAVEQLRALLQTVWAERARVEDAVPDHSPDAPPERLLGVLRGLHLDKDWIEIKVQEPTPGVIRIHDVSESLDDAIGPLVNRTVVVDVVRKTVNDGERYSYRDIHGAD